MNHRFKRVVVISVLIAVSGTAAATAATRSRSDASDITSRLQSVAPGPQMMTRAYGLDASSAKMTLTTARGRAAGVVAGNGVKCLEFSDSSDSCSTDATISAGLAVNVVNDCGAGARSTMDITGLVPDEVTAVRLVLSDGTARTTKVTNGAYTIGAATPRGDGDVRPTSIQWVGQDGATSAEHVFPLKTAADYCPGG
jgi:hypothetical protein